MTTGPTYIPFSGFMQPWATEAQIQVPRHARYLVSKLSMGCGANSAGSDVTVRIRINGRYGNLRVTFTSGAGNTVKQDLVNSDYVYPGDLVCLEISTPTSGSITLHSISSLWTHIVMPGESPGLWFEELSSDNPPPAISGGVTAYGTNFGTGTTGGLTEAPWQVTARQAYSIDYFDGYILTNTLDNGYNTPLRRNGADSNPRLNLVDNQLGQVSDARGSAIYAPGDLYDFSASTPAGAGSLTASIGTLSGHARARPYAVYLRTAVSFNLTRVMPLTGEAHAASVVASAAAALVANYPYIPLRVKNLSVKPLTNSMNGATTFTVRTAGGLSTVTVSIPAGSTTVVEDLVHSVDLSTPVSDALSVEINTTASTSGSITAFITVEVEPFG